MYLFFLLFISFLIIYAKYLDKYFSKYYASVMNTKKLYELKIKAKMTLAILEKLEAKVEPQQIVAELGVNRQLVEYYLNKIKNDKSKKTPNIKQV